MGGLLRTRRGIAELGAAIASAFLLAACGTRDDNGVGVGFIEDLGELKAVRDTVFSPPDTTADFHLANPPPGVALSGSLLTGARPGYLARSFLLFDPAVLPDSGTVVDSATVHLIARADNPDTGSPFTMTVHRVTSAWDEEDLGVDSIPSYLTAASDTVRFDSFAEDDTASFAISLAQFWVDHPDSNFGVAFVPADGTSSFVEFGSQETSNPPRFSVAWGGAEPVDLSATEDSFVLETIEGEWMPLTGTPGRMTVARGVPARSLLLFDLPLGELPGFSELTTVNRAELVLHVDRSASLLSEFTVGIQRVRDEPWAADSTKVTSLLLGATSVSAETDSVALVITSHVQDVFHDGNFGFLLRALDERPDADYVRFHAYDTEAPAKAPALRLWYTPGDVGEGGP